MGILNQKKKNIMKVFAAALALVQANVMQDRLDLIMGHAQRLSDNSLDMADNKDALYMDKLAHWSAAIATANGDRNGEECDAAVEEGADVQVFSADDWCKLNSQINSAARRWGCDGRGRFARQAVRRLKKVKNQYSR